jgi:hypothetical protein
MSRIQGFWVKLRVRVSFAHSASRQCVPAQACAALGLVFEWQANYKILETAFTNKTGNALRT